MGNAIRNPAGVQVPRSSKWIAVVLSLLLRVDTAAALSCKPPERAPTAEEHQQLAVFYGQRDAARKALNTALRADPVLSLIVEKLEQVGWYFPYATQPAVLPPLKKALRLAREDELLALALLQAREDLGEAQRRQLIEHWQDRGLPWTVLASEPVNPDDPADRARLAAALRESLALPLNNALAVRVRELGIRYFELVERHPEPELSEALSAVDPSCSREWVVTHITIGLSALNITALPVRYGFIEAECEMPAVEFAEICERWTERLKAELPDFMQEPFDAEREAFFDERVETCGLAALLRAIQAHYGDWPQIEAQLRDCKPAGGAVTAPGD